MAEDLKALREAEAAVLRRVAEKSPERLVRPNIMDSTALLPPIGIKGVAPHFQGYLRYALADFIVEEVTQSGDIATIDTAVDISSDTTEALPTLYVDVVKADLNTFDAVAELAQKLQIDPTKIGYAGLKDRRAITSQRMSLRHIRWEQITQATFDHLLVKFQAVGKGAMQVGQLKGNKFTIFVRTPTHIDEAEIMPAFQTFGENGFPNFFGAQRFGARLLNGQLGKLVCRGEIEAAIKLYLTEPGYFDIPLHREIRLKAAEYYGNWAAMTKIFSNLPFSFRYELIMLETLASGETNPYRVLASLEEQARFWIFGYSSLLVNQLLSAVLQGEASAPEKLPLALGGSASDDLYEKYLEADGTTNYQMYLNQCRFYVQKFRTIPAWIIPELHALKTLPSGVILSFSLPKGAYATSFLMFLFSLTEGNPVPAWVQPDEIDTKAELGTGSSFATLNQLNLTSGVDLAQLRSLPDTTESSE
jgi:TruD family tRNA pseudouridine synthase